MQPLVDVRFVAAALELRYGRPEVVIEYQGFDAGVLQDEFEFVSNQTPVEWNDHTANFGYGKKRFHEFNGVHQQQPDAIPFL